jgi:hypothetical protein
MTRDPGAQKGPGGSGNPRGENHDPDAHPIIRVWATGGSDSRDSAASPNPPDRSATPSTDTVTDDALACITKRKLAALLMISVRSLDRAIAEGVVPEPDLWIGPSPRWTGRTISRWLRTRPKLPGRGRKGAHDGR